MKADQILAKAAEHMKDRAAERDQGEERSMGKCVRAFNAITGRDISERDGWLFMVLLKATRAASTAAGRPDDYEDMAAYASLAGECAAPAFMGIPVNVINDPQITNVDVVFKDIDAKMVKLAKEMQGADMSIGFRTLNRPIPVAAKSLQYHRRYKPVFFSKKNLRTMDNHDQVTIVRKDRSGLTTTVGEILARAKLGPLPQRIGMDYFYVTLDARGQQ